MRPREARGAGVRKLGFVLLVGFGGGRDSLSGRLFLLNFRPVRAGNARGSPGADTVHRARALRCRLEGAILYNLSISGAYLETRDPARTAATCGSR